MSDTRIDEIAPAIYRISTRAPGFTFNQFLIVDDEPVMFHTGMRRIFADVRAAMTKVMPPEKLRWISFGHFEADECGSIAEWLALAPNAKPLCGRIGAMLSIEDAGGRAAHVLADGESMPIGDKRVVWYDTPHVPHGWDAGVLAESTTRTLFSGDLFTQGGKDHAPVSEHDLVGPSQALRKGLDYYANTRAAAVQVERLAAIEPTLLACMHGTSFRGDGGGALRDLARVLASE